jgi:hypothetical protein
MNEEQEKFEVDDDIKAEWCITKLREEEQETERLKELCKKMIESYEYKIRELDERHEQKTSFLKSQLNQYFLTVKKKVTKTQETYELATATLRLKHKKPKPITDNAKLLEYLEDNNKSDYIEIKKSPKWGELKKTLKQVDDFYVDDDGQIVGGVKLEAVTSEFVIDLKGE